jgi:hypothetical protein
MGRPPESPLSMLSIIFSTPVLLPAPPAIHDTQHAVETEGVRRTFKQRAG